MNELLDFLKPDSIFELIGLGLTAFVLIGALSLLGYVATKLRNLVVAQGRVEAQFSNNGGSTLKDAVDRLEANLEAHTANSAEVHAAIFARLDTEENKS